MRLLQNSVPRNPLLLVWLILLVGCSGDADPPQKSEPAPNPKTTATNPADASTSSNGQSAEKTDPKTPTSANPTSLLRVSLEDAALLLRNRDIDGFLLGHAPIEELRRLRENGTVDAVVNALRDNSEAQVRLLQIYELASRLEMLPNATTGLVELTVILPDAAPSQSRVRNLSDPDAEDVTLPPGFSDDLVECLTLAADALSGGALPAFISKMFPPSDFREYAAGSDGLELVQFLDRNPAMITAMETELRALAKQTPEISEDGRLVTFEYNGRKVRFQLVDGSWRFFDDSLPVRSVMFQQSQQQPTDVRVTLRFERIGDDWRAYEWPAELMALLTPRDESL